MPSKFVITRDGFAALVRGESVELHDPAGARCEIALEEMPIGTMQQLVLRAANVTQKTRPQKIGQAGGQDEAGSDKEADSQEEAADGPQSLSERAEKAARRQRRQRQTGKRQKRYAEQGYQEEARQQEEAGESRPAEND